MGSTSILWFSSRGAELAGSRCMDSVRQWIIPTRWNGVRKSKNSSSRRTRADRPRIRRKRARCCLCISLDSTLESTPRRLIPKRPNLVIFLYKPFWPIFIRNSGRVFSGLTRTFSATLYAAQKNEPLAGWRGVIWVLFECWHLLFLFLHSSLISFCSLCVRRLGFLLS